MNRAIRNAVHAIAATASTIMASSCTDTIDMDYNTIDAIAVVEAHLSNMGFEATVCHTLDMSDTVHTQALEGATITIESATMAPVTLTADDEGEIRTTGVRGQAGERYTLTLTTADGRTSKSSCTMPSPPIAFDAEFGSVKVLGEEYVTLDLRIATTDTTGDASGEQYFYYEVMRNGERYHWSRASTKGALNGVAEKTIICFAVKDREKKNPEDDGHDDILWDGDEIEVRLYAIDAKIYEYLSELGMSGRTSANPQNMFSDNTLGYFSAEYAIIHPTIIFHL